MIDHFTKVFRCKNIRSGSTEYFELKIKFLLYLNGFNHTYLYVLMRPERNDTGPINLLRFFIEKISDLVVLNILNSK